MPTARGHLSFDPRVASIDSKPWWLILRCDYAWYEMYERWITRAGYGKRWVRAIDSLRVNPDGQSLDLAPRLALSGGVMPPAWGPHISVMRGERPRAQEAKWGKYEGYQYTFEYNPEDIRRNGEYIWTPVRCGELLDLRETFGLRRDPGIPLHLTIAHWK